MRRKRPSIEVLKQLIVEHKGYQSMIIKALAARGIKLQQPDLSKWINGDKELREFVDEVKRAKETKRVHKLVIRKSAVAPQTKQAPKIILLPDEKILEASDYPLTRTREIILGTIKQYDGLLSMKELAKMIGISKDTVRGNILVLEHRLGLIETKKEVKKGILYIRKGKVLKIKELSDEEKLRKKLMERFSLEELEFEILDKVEVGESVLEAAIRLRALVRQVEVRMEVSILLKFEVESFGEAKAIFLRRKKELMVPLVV